MVENKQQTDKKKTGLAWRIFRWIGLCLLVLLLIAAVFYQAPWKIITLLAIVLSACTLIPKPHRKWFWLSAGVIVIMLIVWVLLPEDDEGWRPYTFDKELAEFEAKYTIPDEENAALIYDEVFENLDIDTNQPDFFLKTRPSSKDEFWLSKDHTETAEWLKTHQDTIEKLLQASKKDKCIFLPINANLYAEYIEYLPEVRQSAWLLISAANNDVAEGRIGAALEKYFSVIRMANHMYQQLAIIQNLVGFAIERMALEQLNRFVIEGQPSTEQLQLVSKSIQGVENNWSSDFLKILEYEKLIEKNMLCSLAFEKNVEDKVRLSRSTFATKHEQYTQKIPPNTYHRRKCAKLGVIFVWIYVPSTPDKISKIVDASFEKYFAMTEPEFDWSKQPQRWDSFLTSSNFRRLRFNYTYGAQLAANMSAESYYSIHEIYFRNLALRRGSRLLIAIKQYHYQHGTWPDTLDAIKSDVPADALIDPVTSNQFEYENHGIRFSLFGESVNIWPK